MNEGNFHVLRETHVNHYINSARKEAAAFSTFHCAAGLCTSSAQSVQEEQSSRVASVFCLPRSERVYTYH